MLIHLVDRITDSSIEYASKQLLLEFEVWKWRKEMKKTTTSEKTGNKLKYQKKSAWDALKPSEEKLLEKRSADYVTFLRECKTERETIRFLEAKAKKLGFRPLPPLGLGKKLKPGEKVYFINKNRAMGLAVIGKKPANQGLRMVAAHHDVPHLDLKSLPLYEKSGLAFFKTHYYGGIKKFQWAAIPLALHGFIITKTGKTISFAIGEKQKDPVFTITDVAPHLSYNIQDERKARDVIKGEELNILIANRPDPEKKKDASAKDERIKNSVIAYLKKEYGLEEEDLAWGEIAAVPAFEPRELGFDRSMIGGFGHDDRACVMAAFEAISEVKVPEYTASVMFLDKEEIGSAGASGAQSMMVSDFMAMLVEASAEKVTYREIRRSISETLVLSADTSASLDPNFESAWDPTNAGFLGNGVWISKFTGARGKTGSSEADVEFIARLRTLFTREGIPYQFGEMGKVDEGGGGTVARFLAEQNMHVLDLALPTLSLHSPFEVISKADYHFSVSAYRFFLEKNF